MADIINVGDRVIIPKYSELFGINNSDPIVDRQMKNVIFKVTSKTDVPVTDDITGKFIEGFGVIDLVEEVSGKRLEYLIATMQVKKTL